MRNMDRNDYAIRLHQVTRAFGSRAVIRELSLDIERNEIFGLLGPSGSGKTTLVKLIAGIDEASSGEVTLLGNKLPKLSMLERIGYMAQSDALYGELSAKENLAFFAALFGLKGVRGKERMAYVMELVGLADAMKQRVNSYSGGMKRRLSLAIALLHEPEVLILDEADKCHRLGMIREGALIAFGTPETLKNETGSATIEDAFLHYGGAAR